MRSYITQLLCQLSRLPTKTAAPSCLHLEKPRSSSRDQFPLFITHHFVCFFLLNLISSLLRHLEFFALILLGSYISHATSCNSSVWGFVVSCFIKGGVDAQHAPYRTPDSNNEQWTILFKTNYDQWLTLCANELLNLFWCFFPQILQEFSNNLYENILRLLYDKKVIYPVFSSCDCLFYPDSCK